MEFHKSVRKIFQLITNTWKYLFHVIIFNYHHNVVLSSGMKSIWMIPVLVSILILGALGYSQDTFSQVPMCIPPPDGMISWWPGDDNADDIQDDNHGTLSGDATFVAGKVGQAFTFDGAGDFVNIDGLVNDVESNSAGTVDLWVKYPNGNEPAAGDTGNIFTVSKGDGTDNYFQINVHEKKIRFCLAETGSFRCVDELRTSANFDDGKFHHVAVTSDGTTTKLYVDGVQKTGGDLAVDNQSGKWFDDISGEANARIGGILFAGIERSFDGIVDEVEVFDRALDATEILAIFNADSAGKCKVPSVIEVEIDIKPGSDPNSINCKANKKGIINGVVPIGISTDGFDAASIDTDNLTLNGQSTTEVHGTVHIEDSTAVIHVSTSAICAATSVDNKGLEDVVVGGENDDGPFEGTDTVRIVKR